MDGFGLSQDTVSANSAPVPKARQAKGIMGRSMDSGAPRGDRRFQLTAKAWMWFSAFVETADDYWLARVGGPP